MFIHALLFCRFVLLSEISDLKTFIKNKNINFRNVHGLKNVYELEKSTALKHVYKFEKMFMT
jgi:hypothetical protein